MKKAMRKEACKGGKDNSKSSTSSQDSRKSKVLYKKGSVEVSHL